MPVLIKQVATQPKISGLTSENLAIRSSDSSSESSPFAGVVTEPSEYEQISEKYRVDAPVAVEVKPLLVAAPVPVVLAPAPVIVKSGIPSGRAYLKQKPAGQRVIPNERRFKVSDLPDKPIDKAPKLEYNDLIREFYPKCETCRDTREVLVYDTCEKCDGAGCHKCNNTGEVKNYIRCPECLPR